MCMDYIDLNRESPKDDFPLPFFQAEDGIRDIGVTGVQTCALPILTLFWYLRRTVRYVSVWIIET